MEGSDQTVLKEGECGFNGVGVNVALHVDFALVADAPVAHVFVLS